jgi:hypothetical protein
VYAFSLNKFEENILPFDDYLRIEKTKIIITKTCLVKKIEEKT